MGHKDRGKQQNKRCYPHPGNGVLKNILKEQFFIVQIEDRFGKAKAHTEELFQHWHPVKGRKSQHQKEGKYQPYKYVDRVLFKPVVCRSDIPDLTGAFIVKPRNPAAVQDNFRR